MLLMGTQQNLQISKHQNEFYEIEIVCAELAKLSRISNDFKNIQVIKKLYCSMRSKFASVFSSRGIP